MGKNYDDALAFILDGAAESYTEGECSNLTPSDHLRAVWEAWENKVAAALNFWGRGHGRAEQMEEIIQNELYAFDVYATLEGWGVSIDDGRWDEYLYAAPRHVPAIPPTLTNAERRKARDASDRVMENLKMHLKKWLAKDSHALSNAVDEEAITQCNEQPCEECGEVHDDEYDDPFDDRKKLHGLGESVALDISKIQNKNQAAAALRKLGYAKSFMQMTRNATSYSLEGKAPRNGTLMITLGVGHFLITGNKRWNFGSMMMLVGNLREGAEVRLQVLVATLAHMGILQPDTEVTPLQLAVAIAVGEHMERSGAVN